MKENRIRITIAIVAIILLLVCGGLFVMQSILRPNLWVTLPLNDFILTNDQGEVLKTKDGFFTDDSTMEVLEIGGSFDNIRIRVAYSDFFTLEVRQPTKFELHFGVQWDDRCQFIFFDADSDGIASLAITQNSISVHGEVTNYQLCAFTEQNSSIQYVMRGEAACFICLNRSVTAATAESSSSYEFQVRDLHTGEVFSSIVSSDGAAQCIENIIS